MNRIIHPVYLIFLAVLGLVLLVSCSSPTVKHTPMAISPTLTATTTPTPDSTAVAESTYQAMLNINKTQNAAHFATSAARLTDTSQADPPVATPTRRPPATPADAQSRLLTEVPPRIYDSYPSPDGNWEAQVIIYDCTSVDPEAPGGNSLEQLVLIRLSDSTRTIVDTQFINCGGLGASGLEGRFWTNDSKFFFYTSARDGVPDGCGYFWARPLMRVDITNQLPTRFGSSVISPDGKMIAAWISGQLEIWETSGGQIAMAQTPVPVASTGPIVWSPDNRSVAYLLGEEQCMTGDTHVITVALADMEPLLAYSSENQSFFDLSWDNLNSLTLFDRERNAWSLNLTTGQLTSPNN
ncbi:MAG: hypothetical protein JSV42_15410 [Chloroflexota bacterium]|nr:MAG: hypothetical protein JSV42_15410 [Chloroflexota bacterium]